MLQQAVLMKTVPFYSYWEKSSQEASFQFVEILGKSLFRPQNLVNNCSKLPAFIACKVEIVRSK